MVTQADLEKAVEKYLVGQARAMDVKERAFFVLDTERDPNTPASRLAGKVLATFFESEDGLWSVEEVKEELRKALRRAHTPVV